MALYCKQLLSVVLNNMNNTKFLIGAVVGLILGGIAGYYFGYDAGWEKALRETPQPAAAALETSAQVEANPLQNVKTNPYENVKINPFE